MDGKSLDIKQDMLQRLKELFPDVFTENQVDWEKLKAAFSDDINFANERYVLNWAGKGEAFKVLQQPTTATLKPVPEESVNFDKSENIFIEGENLEVLKVLQKAYYGKVKCIIIDPPYNTGSDSFIYPDRFSEKKEDYLKRIGDKDEEGYLMKEGLFRKNSKDSGHFHSNWLSMMYPRLFLAKNLLRDDGVIFVHIDDNEVHNLRMVMNEIFGEENFVGQLIWKSRKYPDSSAKTGLSTDHEYILIYRRSEFGFLRGLERDERKFNNPDNDYRGRWMSRSILGLATKEQRPNLHYPIKDPKTDRIFLPPVNTGWRYSQDRMQKLIDEGRILFPDSPTGRPREKKFRSDMQNDFIAFPTIIDNIFTADGTTEIRELFDYEIFDFSKPSKLIKQLLFQITSDNDLILDFFAGSATTAQAVLELNKDGGNRKFILVQMPEPCDENSEAYKAGYKTIADIAKERIRRVIGKIDKEVIVSEAKQSQGNLLEATKIASSQTPRNDNTQDLGFKVFKLSPSNFKIWKGDEINSEEKLTEQLDAFTNPLRPGAEKQNMLYELMLKAGYGLTSPVQYVIASEAKQSQKGKKVASGSVNPCNDNIGYYSINNNELIIDLDVVNEKVVEQIIASKPQKVITLDSLFAGNDQLKTNTVLQMRDAGVDFKTV